MNGIKARLALVANVSADAVHVSVSAASVLIISTIDHDQGDTTTSAMLSAALSSPSAASILLGITVETSPTVETHTIVRLVLAPSPPSPSPLPPLQTPQPSISPPSPLCSSPTPPILPPLQPLDAAPPSPRAPSPESPTSPHLSPALPISGLEPTEAALVGTHDGSSVPMGALAGGAGGFGGIALLLVLLYRSHRKRMREHQQAKAATGRQAPCSERSEDSQPAGCHLTPPLPVKAAITSVRSSHAPLPPQPPACVAAGDTTASPSARPLASRLTVRKPSFERRRLPKPAEDPPPCQGVRKKAPRFEMRRRTRVTVSAQVEVRKPKLASCGASNMDLYAAQLASPPRVVPPSTEDDIETGTRGAVATPSPIKRQNSTPRPNAFYVQPRVEHSHHLLTHSVLCDECSHHLLTHSVLQCVVMYTSVFMWLIVPTMLTRLHLPVYTLAAAAQVLHHPCLGGRIGMLGWSSLTSPQTR